MMLLYIRLLAFWLAIGGLSNVACSHRGLAGSAQQGDQRKTATERVQVASLRRTACFGSCPVFLAEVWSDGQVTWQGERHVARLGHYTAQAPATWIAELLKEAEQSGFFRLGGHYPTNGRLVSDLPQTITMLRQNNKEYRVTDNADAPLGLLQFERYWQEKLEELSWNMVKQ